MRYFLIFLAAGSALAAEPQHIIFDRLGPQETVLYVAKADGSEEKPLLSAAGGMDYNPAYSADGKWIVFTSERNGSADLYRVKADGTGLERLTDDPAYDDQAAYSPDGRRIVFVSTRDGGRANLWTLELGTRQVKRLTEGSWGDFRPSWSPDGKWIAFSSDRHTPIVPAAGRWEQLHLVDLYLITPEGSGLRRLTQPGGFCGSPKWSQDSRRLVAYCMSAQDSFDNRLERPLGKSRLVSIDVATGTQTEILTSPGALMSPAFVGGNEIGYLRKSSDNPGIFYTNGKTGPRGKLRAPSWSPDGSLVVYHKILSSVAPLTPKKTFSRLPSFELSLTQQLPAYNPSGDRFLVSRPQNGVSELDLVESATGKSRVFFQQAGKSAMAAQWSPRGDSVIFGLGIFFLERAQGAQVATMYADGTGFRQLTQGPNNNAFPSYAPDGKQIVYRTVGPEGQGLRVMNLEDGTVRTLTSDYDNFPLWSPRGDLIVFTRRVDGDFELFTIHPDGSGLKRLTYSPGNEGHCAWSPDGEWILFSSARMGYKDEAIFSDAFQPYGELFVMRYDGTQVQQLTDNQWEDATPSWQPLPPQPARRLPGSSVPLPSKSPTP